MNELWMSAEQVLGAWPPVKDRWQSSRGQSLYERATAETTAHTALPLQVCFEEEATSALQGTLLWILSCGTSNG